MIRIISGKYRGRKLNVPMLKGLRPTTDRTRGAIFNLLIHRLPSAFDELKVLDAFAGSGALGFEAMSRGAKSVTFVENNPIAIRHLRTTLLDFDGDASVIEGNAYETLSGHEQTFDLIFLDPPFGETDFQALIDRVAKSACLGQDGLVVIEHPSQIRLHMPREFAIEVDRAYGRSNILVLHKRVETT